MDEVKSNILETKEVRAFDTVEWIKKQIEGVEREFEKDYSLANITVGISAGIPSGVTASLTVTLTKKEEERRKE